MSSFEIDSGNSPFMNPNNEKNNIDLSIDENNRNKKIKELRSKLNELKKKEKDYDSLNQRYKQLENDFSILNEAKVRLEYEIKQREIEYNRRISDLKGENETLKLGLNDRFTGSKNLFTQNDLLERELRLKDNEIKILNKKLSDLSCQLDCTDQQREKLLKMVNDLKINNMNQNEQICRLNQDNQCLTKICQDNDKNIIMGESDLNKLSKTINEKYQEMENLNGKILCHKQNINDLQRKLNIYNDRNCKLQNDINNYKKEIDICNNENERLKNDLCNQRALTNANECKNEKLKNILMDREREISQICHDNENIRLMNEECNNNSEYYRIENIKLSNQIKILEKQNVEIINEIDNILKERRRMDIIAANNNRCFEREIDSSNRCLNMTYNTYDNCHYSPKVPRYTYQFRDKKYI